MKMILTRIKRRVKVFLWSDGVFRDLRRSRRLYEIRKVKKIYDLSDMD